MNSEKIAVIGAGSWGTALSLHLSRLGYTVDLWVFEQELCQSMQTTRENTVFLPGHSLPDNIHPTNSLEAVTKNHSVIIVVVPSHVMRKVAEGLSPHLQPGSLVINASKGLENETLSTMNEILRSTLGENHHLATISGPTFAAEIAGETPSALVAAAENIEIAERVQRIFDGPTVKVFTSTDILGVEIGAALKNVIAIATGISDGLQLGYNARAALITRGLVEISRIGTALGARPETFYGLSGMGDLVLTCTGDLSRNRTVGIKLGRGLSLEEITGGMSMVAEGVRTVKSAFALKNKLSIQATIIDETYRILYDNKPPQKALEDVMRVKISTEFSGVKGLL